MITIHPQWFRILAEISLSRLGDEKRAKKPRTPNTGLDRYILTTRCSGEKDGKPMLEKIVFDLISCGKHLDTVSTY